MVSAFDYRVSKKSSVNHKHGEAHQFIVSIDMQPTTVAFQRKHDIPSEIDFPTRATFTFSLMGSPVRGLGDDIDEGEALKAVRKLISALHRDLYPAMHGIRREDD